MLSRRRFSRFILSVGILPLPALAQASAGIPIFLEESLQGDPKRNSGGQVNRMVKYLHEKSDINLQPQFMSWKRALVKSRAGEGLIFGLSKTPERLKYYYFSDPVIASNIWGISHDPALAAIKSANELKGKVVSVERGVSHGMEFEQLRNTLFTVDEDPNDMGLRLKKLLAKRSDMMLWPNSVFQHSEQIEQNLHKTLIPALHDAELSKQRFYVTAQPLFFDPIHFACAKGVHQAEIDKINQALRLATKNGDLVKLLALTP